MKNVRGSTQMKVRGRTFSLRVFDATMGTVLLESGPRRDGRRRLPPALVAGWSVDSATGAVRVLGSSTGEWRGTDLEATVRLALEDLLDQSAELAAGGEREP